MFDEGERIANFVWFPLHILGVLRIPGEILGGSKLPRFHFIDLALMGSSKWRLETSSALFFTLNTKNTLFGA